MRNTPERNEADDATERLAPRQPDPPGGGPTSRPRLDRIPLTRGQDQDGPRRGAFVLALCLPPECGTVRSGDVCLRIRHGLRRVEPPPDPDREVDRDGQSE